MNKIKHTQVDFNSSQVSEARSIVERDLEIIAKRFSTPTSRFFNAFENDLILVGIFETKCGHQCVFIEFEERQLIAPLDLLLEQKRLLH